MWYLEFLMLKVNNKNRRAHRLTYLDAGVVGVGLSACRMGQQDVLGFQVSVDDSFGLKDPHGPSDLLQEYSDGVFT